MRDETGKPERAQLPAQRSRLTHREAEMVYEIRQSLAATVSTASKPHDA